MANCLTAMGDCSPQFIHSICDIENSQNGANLPASKEELGVLGTVSSEDSDHISMANTQAEQGLCNSYTSVAQRGKCMPDALSGRDQGGSLSIFRSLLIE